VGNRPLNVHPVREKNPFRVFCPPNAQYLVLGSFVAKDGKKNVSYEWYYSNGRNQFWPILESIYKIELKTKPQQQALFTSLGIAVADIILECKRIGNSSLDKDLTDFTYNVAAVARVFKNNPIKAVFFTSRFVEKHYKRHFKELIEGFPGVQLITLPSPSPRYVLISKEEKTVRYAQVFPGV
jgi:hypoxanthine-DNA glycosylase